MCNQKTFTSIVPLQQIFQFFQIGDVHIFVETFFNVVQRLKVVNYFLKKKIYFRCSTGILFYDMILT